MADLTPAALRRAARQHGACTVQQLVSDGVSRHTIRRLVTRGVLTAPHKSVRTIQSAPRSLEQRCVELCLAHPETHITGPTAGTLSGLRLMPRTSPIHLASAHPLHVEHSGVRIRRTTKLGPADRRERRDGIRIASPSRLAFDLAATLADRAHRSVLDQLIHEHDVSVEELVQVGRRLRHPTRPGSDRFIRSVLAVSDQPTESDAERRVADALLAVGIAVETNTQWLDLPNGRRARLDLAVPALRWGIEVDVHPSHLGAVGSTDDKRRDRQAAMIGWAITRLTALDLLDLDTTIAELSAVHRARMREFAA